MLDILWGEEMFFSKKKTQEVVEPKHVEAPAVEVEKEIKKPVVIPNISRKKEHGKMEYEVLISKNTSLNGNININGCTRIDGVIDGTLAVDSDLFIGETGVIRATVYAKNATVSGSITGNIACKGRLELMGTARIIGDIKCGTLVIAEGAVFKGKCSSIEAEAGEEAAPVVAPEA